MLFCPSEWELAWRSSEVLLQLYTNNLTFMDGQELYIHISLNSSENDIGRTEHCSGLSFHFGRVPFEVLDITLIFFCRH